MAKKNSAQRAAGSTTGSAASAATDGARMTYEFASVLGQNNIKYVDASASVKIAAHAAPCRRAAAASQSVGTAAASRSMMSERFDTRTPRRISSPWRSDHVSVAGIVAK